MRQLVGTIQLVRPAQWTKNLVLFAALLFSPAKVVIENPAAILYVVQGFLAFCLLSGGVYAFNDLIDLPGDRHHPRKQNRPLPSGRISLTTAIAVAGLLPAIAVIWAFLLDPYFGWIAVAYWTTNVIYTLGLKRAVILDVLLLSTGFVFRAVAGVAVIRSFLPNVYLSYWLILCAFLLSLFLALAKRRHEIATLGEAAAAHRASLAHYNLAFIDQMLATLTAATMVSYSLYTISDDTFQHYGTRDLFWTLPFVVYGLFRYLYLIYYKSEGGDPSSLLVRDKPTLINVALWGIASASIVYLR
ncbi:decaprenyl-phosphate phosphoribosyltransferase [candidate division KSB1 bacterium]|nr:decaprenyl-phosphate phosphoribosyltransferase [candidate division KSB1 bacterium]